MDEEDLLKPDPAVVAHLLREQSNFENRLVQVHDAYLREGGEETIANKTALRAVHYVKKDRDAERVFGSIQAQDVLALKLGELTRRRLEGNLHGSKQDYWLYGIIQEVELCPIFIGNVHDWFVEEPNLPSPYELVEAFRHIAHPRALKHLTDRVGDVFMVQGLVGAARESPDKIGFYGGLRELRDQQTQTNEPKEKAESSLEKISMYKPYFEFLDAVAKRI